MKTNHASLSENRLRNTAGARTDLAGTAVAEISGALRPLLADVFALYLKTKNFHWHMSGSHFRDYHLLLDEHADQIFAMTDDIAERARKIGGTKKPSLRACFEDRSGRDCEGGWAVTICTGKRKRASPNKFSNNVIRWIKRLLSPEPPRSNPAIAEDFHRRLHLAKLRAAVAGDDGAREVGRSSEQMSRPPTFEITPELSRTGLVPPEWLLRARDETLLAAALESILQGERVANEVFLQLYRHGFVFKEKEKKWAITEAGKQLIERHKLQGLQECRVHGLKCRKSWI